MLCTAAHKVGAGVVRWIVESAVEGVLSSVYNIDNMRYISDDTVLISRRMRLLIVDNSREDMRQ